MDNVELASEGTGYGGGHLSRNICVCSFGAFREAQWTAFDNVIINLKMREFENLKMG
ncbi:MAG: hypothetical protein ACOYN4_13880 [Bacteroidales bacterium]